MKMILITQEVVVGVEVVLEMKLVAKKASYHIIKKFICHDYGRRS